MMTNLLLFMILLALIWKDLARLLVKQPRLAGVQIPNFMLWEIKQTQQHIENLAQMGGVTRGRR